MRYAPEHKESTRTRLLEVGGALAKQGGFGTTGVDSLMAAVGLTSGAFYSHFRSKTQLFDAIIESELTRSLERFADKSDAQIVEALEGYLSLGHVDNPADGCAATSLSAEVARAGPQTRQTYEDLVVQIKDAIALHVADEKTAWVIVSQAVGAVMVARAMASDASRQSLLEAVLQHCQGLLAAGKQEAANA